MKLLHFFEYNKENALSPWDDRKKNLAQKSEKGLFQLFFTFSLFYCFYLSFLSQEYETNAKQCIKKCCELLVKKKAVSTALKKSGRDSEATRNLYLRLQLQNKILHMRKDNIHFFSQKYNSSFMIWKLLYSLFHSHMNPFPIRNNILGKSITFSKTWIELVFLYA